MTKDQFKKDVTVRPATRDDIDFIARVLLLANIERHEKEEGWNKLPRRRAAWF